jgi:hypothetical protein
VVWDSPFEPKSEQEEFEFRARAEADFLIGKANLNVEGTSRADQYAAWIVANKDKKGTPEFNTVAAAYREAKGDTTPVVSTGPKLDATSAQSPQSMASVGSRALGNLIPSAGKFIADTAEGLYTAATNPLETIGGALDIGAGALANAMPNKMRQAYDKYVDYNPEATQRSVQSANAVGQYAKQRFGGVEELKETLATDPVGALGDVSMLLSGGSMSAAKIGKLQKLAKALETAGNVTNPLLPIQKAAGMSMQGVGNAAKYYAGMKTGTGAEPISQAVTAGRTGEKTFVENMRGEVPSVNVLDDAKSNLSAMIKQKQADYRQNMANVTSDKTVLDVQPITDAVDNGIQSNSFKGVPKDDKAAAYLQNAKTEIDNWQFKDPAEFHTPEGLDALKQRVGSILESIPYQEANSRRVVGNVYNEIKNQIGKQAPTYADTMKAYSEASDLISEIEKTLSLRPGASVDTSMRKLQSLMRNNVNTNYGQRLTLATELENQGGRSLRPALAGQALSSFTPRGLQGAVTGPTSYLAYGAGGVPLAISDLISSSPRAVGEMAYKVGQGQRLAGKAASKIPITAKQARLAALLAAQQEQAR